MKRIRRSLALAGFACILPLSFAAVAETQSPSAVTQGVYQFALAHPGFASETIKPQKKYLTPDLYSRLMKKLNQPVPKGDAPDIEGDVFLDCQDPPSSFQVGASAIDRATAKVEVTLLWPQEKRHCTVLLKQVSGAWKVDDIVYDKDGRLSDLLK